MTTPERIPLGARAGGLAEFWSQEVVGRANGQLLKVAKGIGETNWHSHDDQDETFVVLRGRLVVQLRTGDVTLGAGEMLVIPSGVEHRPVAAEEVHLLLIGSAITSDEAGGKPAWSRATGAPPASHADLARAMYRAYETGDRDAIESVIGDPFEFWSPLDGGIDRATYFERCWANHDLIDAIELQRVTEISAREVVVTYQLVKQDGSRAQNTEIITFDGDRAVKVEVYFGWDLSPASV
jgi:mannose-6-phosphate isomerase-like protein (cupin superfamily)